MFDGDTTSIVVDPAHVEPMRRYLLGMTGFPASIIVCATVATDVVSQGLCMVPTRVPENPHVTYSLTTRGLYFRFTFDPPAKMKQICVASSETQPIFIKDCSEKTLRASFRLMETTVRKGSLRNSA